MKRTIESLQPNEVIKCSTPSQFNSILELLKGNKKGWKYSPKPYPYKVKEESTVLTIENGAILWERYSTGLRENRIITNASDFLSLNQRLIGQLRRGEIAVENTNGTLGELREVIAAAKKTTEEQTLDGTFCLYVIRDNGQYYWEGYDGVLNLPVKTIAEFYEIALEEPNTENIETKSGTPSHTEEDPYTMPSPFCCFTRDIEFIHKLIKRDLTMEEVKQIASNYKAYEKIYLKANEVN